MPLIHIACSADARFVPDCAVMLHSLLQANPSEKIEVHFLHDEKLSDDLLARLGSVVKSGGGTWSPKNIEREVRRSFPDTKRYGLNAWYRILLPRLLPQLDKILYLDSDLLIVDRIRPLWETDIESYCLAAITNPLLDSMLPRIRDTLGIQDRTRYFNSGVMLLNLKRLREGGYVDRLVDLIQSREIPMPWADQDPLNAVLHAECLLMPPRWNTMCAIFDLPWRYLPWDVDAMKQARRNPAIIHYIGAYKPWHYRLRHPYKAAYFRHLEETPFHNRRRNEGRTLRHILLKYLPALWGLYIDGWIINNIGPKSVGWRRLLGKNR